MYLTNLFIRLFVVFNLIKSDFLHETRIMITAINESLYQPFSTKIAKYSYVISTENNLGRGGSLKVPMVLHHSRRRSCVVSDELPMLIPWKSTTRLWQIWRNGRYGYGQS